MITATWVGREEFRVGFEGGETLTLASVPRAERPGPGPSPVDTVLAALAACTGIDVVLILEKMRKTVSSLHVDVSGERREEHPRIFTTITLVYRVDGPDLTEDAVRRAVTLSQETYCSVSGMLQTSAAFQVRIALNGREI